MSSKVSVVGVGQVGMACAFAVLVGGKVRELVLVDVMAEKVRGEMMDLQHGLLFTKPCTITSSTEYSVTANSDICVITAGARQNVGETRIELVNRNVEIFKGIIPKLIEHSPNAVLLVVSNPVDIMTFITWKLSGFPKSRVFGSGTNLDSARLKFFLSEKLKISPKSCHAWIIGEHGDSSVAVWSSANIAGMKLSDFKQQVINEKSYDEIHKQVVQSAYEIISLKGYTSWAIGLSVAHICRCILSNSRNVLALSVNANGMHGIKEDVFLSLPAVVGKEGIVDIISQVLSSKEQEEFKNSVKYLLYVQQKIKL